MRLSAWHCLTVSWRGLLFSLLEQELGEVGLMRSAQSFVPAVAHSTAVAHISGNSSSNATIGMMQFIAV